MTLRCTWSWSHRRSSDLLPNDLVSQGPVLALLGGVLTLGAAGCVHASEGGTPTSVAAPRAASSSTASTDPNRAERPWLALHDLERLTFGGSGADQSNITGDNQRLFWVKTENQARSLVMVELSPGEATTFTSEPRPLFGPEFDTLDPAWNPKLQTLAFVSFGESARGKICIWKPSEISGTGSRRGSSGNGTNVSTPLSSASSSECFDHPGRVSQPVWGPDGRIFFLLNALPWEEAADDGIWVLDPNSRISRKVVTYSRLGGFDVHPQTADIVAVGWSRPLGQVATPEEDVLSRPRLLVFPAKRPGAHLDPERGYGDPVPLGVESAGLPASPRFDERGQELYWSEFLEDSNQESRVVAEERSVVLKARYDRLRDPNARKIPDPLTAAHSNCASPRVLGDRLFLTCAPEFSSAAAPPVLFRSKGGRSEAVASGSKSRARQLDLYALGQEGVIPKGWDTERLFQVRQQAREPSVQILLTNALRARTAERDDGDLSSALLLDLVALHLREGQINAADEVFDLWSRQEISAGRSAAPELKLVLDALRLSRDTAGQEIAQSSVSAKAALRQRVEALERRRSTWQESLAADPKSSQEVRHDDFGVSLSLATLFLNTDSDAGRGHQGGLPTQEGPAPWEAAAEHVFAALTSSLSSYGRTSESLRGASFPKSRAARDEVALVVVEHWIVTEQAKGTLSVSEALRLLTRLADVAFDVSPQAALSFALRALDLPGKEESAQRLLHAVRFRQPELEGLRQSHAEALALVAAAAGKGRTVDEASRARFRDLNDRLEEVLRRSGPLAYRAHASAVARVLSTSDQTLLLGYHVTNWLSRTPLLSLDYGVLLEFYRFVTFERAYAAWAQGDTRAAADLFYQAVRLTRDEEAQLGFLLTSLASGQSGAEIRSRFESLATALGESSAGLPLMTSVMALADAQQLPEADVSGRRSRYRQALEALEVPQDSEPVVRDFVRGTIAHERFRLSLSSESTPWWQRHRPAGDTREFERAVRSLSSALDRAGRRGHIRGALRAELAKVHFLAGNAGLSADAMAEALRDLRPESPERGPWTLLYARALARSGRVAQAVQALEVLAQSPGFAEKVRGEWSWWPGLLAFYAAEAGDHAKACDLVRERFESSQSSIPSGVSTGFLGQKEHQAWACYKAARPGDWDLATTLLTEIADAAGRLKPVPGARERNDFLDFEPAQIKARAAGVLAQIVADPKDKIRWHLEREEGLRVILGNRGRTALPPRMGYLYLAKSCIERATLLVATQSTDQETETDPSKGERLSAQDALGALECAVTTLEKAAQVGVSGTLIPALDDFQALRQTSLLLVLRLGGTAPRVDPSPVANVPERALLQRVVDIFDKSFGSLVPPGASVSLSVEDSEASRSVFGSWPGDLLLRYLQTAITMTMARELLEATPDQRGAPRVPRACVTAPDALSLEPYLRGAEASEFLAMPQGAALREWCAQLPKVLGH